MSITSAQIHSIVAETTHLCEMVYAEIEQRHATDQGLLALPLTNIQLNADKTMFDEEVGYMRGDTDGITQDECAHIKAKALRGADSTLEDLGKACELTVNDFNINMGTGPINPLKLGRWMMIQSLQQQSLFAIRNLLEGTIELKPDGYIVIFLKGEQFIKKGDEGWKKAVGEERHSVSVQTIRDATEAAIALNRQMKHKLDHLYTGPVSFS